MKELHVANPPSREVEAKYLAQIKTILTRALSGKPCAVYLFGSRAMGAASAVSDFDIAVLAEENVSGELSLAREELEESSIPYKVDVVDLHTAPAAFKEMVLRQGVLLWKN